MLSLVLELIDLASMSLEQKDRIDRALALNVHVMRHDESEDRAQSYDHGGEEDNFPAPHLKELEHGSPSDHGCAMGVAVLHLHEDTKGTVRFFVLLFRRRNENTFDVPMVRLRGREGADNFLQFSELNPHGRGPFMV